MYKYMYCFVQVLPFSPIPSQTNIGLKVAFGTHRLNIKRGGGGEGEGGSRTSPWCTCRNIRRFGSYVAALSRMSTRALENLLFISDHLFSVDRADPFCSTAGQHFNQLLRRFGAPVVILNLVKVGYLHLMNKVTFQAANNFNNLNSDFHDVKSALGHAKNIWRQAMLEELIGMECWWDRAKTLARNCVR